ncbi:telomere-protecting terminal protein Tpg [Streptomyces xiamenensis]|uniref:telomere-protecting terminal protein Tpg n=1 Tax=Streptomyces xiamenensis TaxID=408015 RepID=UPI0035DC7718
MATPIGDGIEKMLAAASTRPIPATLRGRVRFLLRTEGTVTAVAARIGVSPTQVRRYLTGETRSSGKAAAIEREVRRSWQPRIRQRTIQQAVRDGIVVDTKAQFGFTAGPGTTDDPRVRLITEPMSSGYTQRLLGAYQAGEGEDELGRIVADSIRYSYFQDSGRRAQDLTEVTFGGIDYVDFELY